MGYIELDEKIIKEVEEVTFEKFHKIGNLIPLEEIEGTIEDLLCEIDRLKESFKKISQKRKDIIEISDEEFKFLKRLVKNQTIISNSRIQDWIPDGVMVKHFKARYFEENKNATEEKFEACRLDIIKYDEDLKICMQELANILGIEYNPNLK